MTAQELTLMALAETNPPVAVALDRVGPNRGGWPLIGLLGWLPIEDRQDLCRAAILAHGQLQTECWYDPTTPEGLARMIYCDGGWRRPRTTRDAGRVDDAIVAYAHAKGTHPLCEIMAVHCLRAGADQCQGIVGMCRCATGSDTSER